jgi:hypothetical protein
LPEAVSSSLILKYVLRQRSQVHIKGSQRKFRACERRFPSFQAEPGKPNAPTVNRRGVLIERLRHCTADNRGCEQASRRRRGRSFQCPADPVETVLIRFSDFSRPYPKICLQSNDDQLGGLLEAPTAMLQIFCELFGDSNARSSKRFRMFSITSLGGSSADARNISNSRQSAPYFAPATRCFSARSE